MASKYKKSIIITLVVGVLAVIGVGGYFLSKEFLHIENNQNVKLEKKLLIGTYKESETTTGEKSFNKLHIEIVNNGDVVKKLSYTTDSKELEEDSDYPNCVFLDLSKTMSEYTDNLGVRFWCLSKLNKNYISVRTEFLYANFLSNEVKLTDCGIYLVNIPTKNDETPQVEHAYIYQTNKVGW